MPAELHPQAARELEEALSWLDEFGESLSAEFAMIVGETLGLLAAQPGVGAPLREPPEAEGLRRHPLRKFNYWVIYEPMPEGIFVYAFAHQKRKPGYWAERLGPGGGG